MIGKVCTGRSRRGPLAWIDVPGVTYPPEAFSCLRKESAHTGGADMPSQVDRVRYMSTAEAAEELGISVSATRHCLTLAEVKRTMFRGVAYWSREEVGEVVAARGGSKALTEPPAGWMTADEAACTLGVARSTVQRYITGKQLRGAEVTLSGGSGPKKRTIVNRDDVDALIHFINSTK